jgi:hypothetical protein
LAREKGFLQEQERLLVSQLSDAFAKTATHFQLVQTTAQQWQAADDEVQTRSRTIGKPGFDVNVFLQSQLRRAEAQISYYRALAEYNKSINYIEYLKGTMLANSNITLAEGPWNKKAYWDALERARERSAGKPLQYGVTRPGVVRRGPVKGADAAMGIVGSGTTSSGAHSPPDMSMMDDPNAGLDLQPYRDAIEVSDRPLSELETPIEILSPDVTLEPIGGFEPLADPGMRAPAGELSQPNRLSHPQPTSLRPLDVPASENVSPMSHQTGVEVSFAPEPVRRKPVPTAP